jgi:proteasome activator subunit 4
MLVPKDDIQQWETRSRTCLDALHESATTSSYWETLKVHYAEENQSDTVNWDNVSFVKSICRWRTFGGSRLIISVEMLGYAPWKYLEPTVVNLLEDKDQNKQRAAAEFLAGVLGGNHVKTDRLNSS